ncbi:MAG: ABC transporter permease [Phycisphaerales bacterium]|nr:ABC transporter permease [Phycisphaerales bacterium]
MTSMTDGSSPTSSRGNGTVGFTKLLIAPLEFFGGRLIALLDQVGAVLLLLLDAGRWVLRSLMNRRVRLGRAAVVTQIVRVGVRSIFIVSLVSGCVGFILAFQLSPPLDEFGRKDLVANIVSVAVLRELGPLIGAIVLTGFAGASMAAEIGTMVVGEEIEALEAHALNPVRFLVVPRVIATVLSMTALAVLADLVSVGASLGVSVLILDIPYALYKSNTLDQAKLVDFLTGIGKATVFGGLIGLIACANGLRVTGGAAGVGRATTNTVVQCVVSIVIADLIFTAIFYALKLV